MTNHNKTKTQKPFIKKFEEDGVLYIFDVNTNQIIEVEQPIYDLIDFFTGADTPPDDSPLNTTYSKQEITHYLDQIKQAHIQNGLFSDFRPSVVSLGLSEANDVRKLHRDYGLNQLILELTRECNLNCGYCSTSGKYYTRAEGTPVHMSWSQCKQAVDFFCKQAGNSRPPAITFYGGEPLLRFDLIQQTVSYVREHYQEQNTQFNLTTNGTLLNEAKMAYFIENNISLRISLDGPESVNDRYRVFKDGNGTYTTIMKSLAAIKEKNPTYFSSRISISGVLAPPFHQIDDILDFYSSHETLKEIRKSIRSNPVSTGDTTFVEDYHMENEGDHFPEVVKKLTARLKSAILKKDLSGLTIEKMQTFSSLQNLARNPIQKVHDFSVPIGACHIGLRRVFVRVSGDFYICERSGNNYLIGNLETGFDYDRIAAFYVKFAAALEDCKECWALNYCERCWIMVGDLDKFKGAEKEKFCTMSKTILENAFKLYVQLLKENPACMEVFR